MFLKVENERTTSTLDNPLPCDSGFNKDKKLTMALVQRLIRVLTREP